VHNVADESGENLNKCLTDAVLRNDTEFALLLLERGADPNAQGPTDEIIPALLMALRWLQPDYRVPHENIVLLNALLNKGADVNSRDSDGETPLIIAAWTNKIESVRVLLQAGADVNAKDNDGYTSLIAAAQYGYTDIVKLLLDWDADINAQTNDGLTALMRAVSRGHIATVRTLLSRNANVRIKTKYRDTALTLAAEAQEQIIYNILRAALDTDM